MLGLRHMGSLNFTAVYGIFSCSKWDLVPWPGIKIEPPAEGVQSLSHWTTREVPRVDLHVCYLTWPSQAFCSVDCTLLQVRKFRLGEVTSFSEVTQMITGTVRFHPGLSDVRLCMGAAGGIHVCPITGCLCLTDNFIIKRPQKRLKVPKSWVKMCLRCLRES